MLSKTGRLGTFSVLARETCRSWRMTPSLCSAWDPTSHFPGCTNFKKVKLHNCPSNVTYQM